jgi:hypothetical protein
MARVAALRHLHDQWKAGAIRAQTGPQEKVILVSGDLTISH